VFFKFDDMVIDYVIVVHTRVWIEFNEFFFYVNWKVVNFIFKLILAILEGFLMYILAVKLVRLLLLIWGCEIDLRN
jgi:hypothetical protein